MSNGTEYKRKLESKLRSLEYGNKGMYNHNFSFMIWKCSTKELYDITNSQLINLFVMNRVHTFFYKQHCYKQRQAETDKKSIKC